MASTHHKGLAGQLAVMAHLAWNIRGVAIPMVDEGTDVLVIRKGNRRPWRVQVKTSTATKTKGAKDSRHSDRTLHRCQFNIPRAQLADDDGPLFYILVGYVLQRFRFVIAERKEIIELAGGSEEATGSYQPTLYFYQRFNEWWVTQSKYLEPSGYDKLLDDWHPLVRRIEDSES